MGIHINSKQFSKIGLERKSFIPYGKSTEGKNKVKKKVKKRSKWWEVYPQGTPEGDEEQRFFDSFRNPKFKYRSVIQISKDSGLSQERVEEIIQKYYNRDMIIQNPKNENQWGYWVNCEKDIPEERMSINEQDRFDRTHEV